MSRHSQVEKESLREYEKRASALHAASEAGNSLRTLALVTGLSHETVRVILERERRRIDHVREVLEQPIAAMVFEDHKRIAARRRRLSASLPVRNPDA